MSSIIDDQFMMKQKEKTEINIQQDQQRNSSKNFDKNQFLNILNKFIQNFDSQYIVNCNESPKQVKVNVLFSNVGLGKTFDLLITIQISIQASLVLIYFELLQQKIPFQIMAYNNRILACKIFSKTSTNNFSKISISLDNGNFKILRPIILYPNQLFIQLLQSNSKNQCLMKIIKNGVKDTLLSCKSVIGLVVPQKLPNFFLSNLRFQEQISSTILRYIIRSPIEPSFDVSFGTGKYDTMQQLTKQQINKTGKMIQNIQLSYKQFSSHSIYVSPNYPLQNLRRLFTYQYFSFNDDQLNLLKQKAFLPTPRTSLNNEIKNVFNIIEFSQAKEISLEIINTGGFSEIKKAQTEFYYISSTYVRKKGDMTTEVEDIMGKKHIKKIYRKYIIFKNNIFSTNDSGRNRVLHEIKIVTKFKSGFSMLMPQYYQLEDKKSPYYNYLLMQFLPYPTLSQYKQQRSSTMSFLTRLHLGYMLIHSLRFLKNNQIVHMDLKPANIFITKRLIPKLIDFGQSYCKEVCDSNYKPAFSMPYGCPEIFDCCKEFNEKADVYSWAVVMFQLIWGRLPYQFKKQRVFNAFKNRLYLKALYFVPQEENNFGATGVMPLLRNLILRALQTDNKNRPCTLWVTVVLKQCLSYLINYEFNLSSY